MINYYEDWSDTIGEQPQGSDRRQEPGVCSRLAAEFILNRIEVTNAVGLSSCESTFVEWYRRRSCRQLDPLYLHH